MNLFQLGDFTLHSGAKSSWKIDCDALSDADIATLAEMIRQLVGPCGKVEGVPRGGLRLAQALKRYERSAGATLIVDDVLTTGISMERMRELSLEGPPFVGVVVFARGCCPDWVTPLFQLPQALWAK